MTWNTNSPFRVAWCCTFSHISLNLSVNIVTILKTFCFGFVLNGLIDSEYTFVIFNATVLFD
jgi:hypothetical protein